MQVKFYPYKKGGRQEKLKPFKFLGSFNTRVSRFSHTEGGGGAKRFHPLKKKGGGGNDRSKDRQQERTAVLPRSDLIGTCPFAPYP